MRGPVHGRRRASHGGFTLVELLLALGLFAILVVALARLLDTSLDLWGRTEASRELMEIGTSALDLLADDLEALEGGPRGDLLAEWTRFDADRDGINDMVWPRLRLVRRASPADLARLQPASSPPSTGAAPAAAAPDPRALGLVEVVWALVPSGADDPDQRSVGVLVRGQRGLADGDTLSFFDPGFVGANGKPVGGSTSEVTGGVLWLDVWLAAETTVLHGGWTLGDGLADASTAWDAWNQDRPSLEASARNRLPTGMTEPDERPVLPRRVRVELEIERPAELRHRTRLVQPIGPEETTLEVRDARRLPPEHTMLLLDEEWMELLGSSGTSLTVRRGRRGSRATAHEAGTLLHHGWSAAREVPIPQHREDWDL